MYVVYLLKYFVLFLLKISIYIFVRWVENLKNLLMIDKLNFFVCFYSSLVIIRKKYFVSYDFCNCKIIMYVSLVIV